MAAGRALCRVQTLRVAVSRGGRALLTFHDSRPLNTVRAACPVRDRHVRSPAKVHSQAAPSARGPDRAALAAARRLGSIRSARRSPPEPVVAGHVQRPKPTSCSTDVLVTKDGKPVTRSEHRGLRAPRGRRPRRPSLVRARSARPRDGGRRAAAPGDSRRESGGGRRPTPPRVRPVPGHVPRDARVVDGHPCQALSDFATKVLGPDDLIALTTPQMTGGDIGFSTTPDAVTGLLHREPGVGCPGRAAWLGDRPGRAKPPDVLLDTQAARGLGAPSRPHARTPDADVAPDARRASGRPARLAQGDRRRHRGLAAVRDRSDPA